MARAGDDKSAARARYFSTNRVNQRRLAPKAITTPRALLQPKVRAHVLTRDRRDVSIAVPDARVAGTTPARRASRLFSDRARKSHPSRSLNRRDAGSTPTRSRAGVRGNRDRERERRARERASLFPVPDPRRLAVPPDAPADRDASRILFPSPQLDTLAMASICNVAARVTAAPRRRSAPPRPSPAPSSAAPRPCARASPPPRRRSRRVRAR